MFSCPNKSINFFNPWIPTKLLMYQPQNLIIVATSANLSVNINYGYAKEPQEIVFRRGRVEMGDGGGVA